MILPAEWVSALSGSVVQSMVEGRPDDEKDLLMNAGWMLTNTRFGKTRITNTLSKQFGVPKSQCVRLIQEVFGPHIFDIRNKSINRGFVKDLKKLDNG